MPASSSLVRFLLFGCTCCAVGAAWSPATTQVVRRASPSPSAQRASEPPRCSITWSVLTQELHETCSTFKAWRRDGLTILSDSIREIADQLVGTFDPVDLGPVVDEDQLAWDKLQQELEEMRPLSTYAQQHSQSSSSRRGWDSEFSETPRVQGERLTEQEYDEFLFELFAPAADEDDALTPERERLERIYDRPGGLG